GAAGRSTANPKHADSAARSKIFNPSANKLRRKWCIGSVPNAAAVQRCRPARPLSSEPPVERLGNEELALVEDGASHARIRPPQSCRGILNHFSARKVRFHYQHRGIKERPEDQRIGGVHRRQITDNRREPLPQAKENAAKIRPIG